MRRYLTAWTPSVLQLLSLGVVLLTGCASEDLQQGTRVSLTGAQEVPPVSTPATGNGQITVLTDRSVSGTVTTSGIAGTAAHIHEAAAGTNGLVIIPLTKVSDNTWAVHAGAKLTESQYAGYRARSLYVNVHSAANPDGEIRGQITPPASPPPAKPSGY